ncbi:MAG: TrkA family potassium uptake protein [Clostridiales bacterium]|nr:TrkA family potassium uptake protein [Clostridiales bacterium]
MRSMLVIGLGRFGSHLALKLMELGNEVMAVDEDEEIVNTLAPSVTCAQIGDCMDEKVLKSLGVANFDICFVCISSNFQSSLEITSLLKELGAKRVISKTNREMHAKFLLKVGADEVVYPERDMAIRTAFKYSARGAFDYIELSREYAIIEIEVPTDWVGSSLKTLNVRSRHHINVIGAKSGGSVVPVTSPDYVFHDGEHLIIAGEKKDLLTLANSR